MVRKAALAALTLLAGCDRLDSTERRSVYADVNASIALKQLEEQRREIAELKEQVARDKRYLDLVSASLDEARENHTKLLKTFNDNVQRANKSDVAHERDIDWLMQRNGVFRQKN